MDLVQEIERKESLLADDFGSTKALEGEGRNPAYDLEELARGGVKGSGTVGVRDVVEGKEGLHSEVRAAPDVRSGRDVNGRNGERGSMWEGGGQVEVHRAGTRWVFAGKDLGKTSTEHEKAREGDVHARKEGDV